MGNEIIKSIKISLKHIGDTLASNSNLLKIFFKICQIKMNIL